MAMQTKTLYKLHSKCSEVHLPAGKYLLGCPSVIMPKDLYQQVFFEDNLGVEDDDDNQLCYHLESYNQHCWYGTTKYGNSDGYYSILYQGKIDEADKLGKVACFTGLLCFYSCLPSEFLLEEYEKKVSIVTFKNKVKCDRDRDGRFTFGDGTKCLTVSTDEDG